jgi:hypothetical protein
MSLKLAKFDHMKKLLIKQSMYQSNFQDHICLTILVPTQLWKKYHNTFLIFFKKKKEILLPKKKRYNYQA